MSDTPAQILRQPAAIAQLLARILDSRCALSVRINDDATVHASQLLDVDYLHGLLRFDELLPASCNERIHAGTRLRIRAQIDGARADFDCTVQQVLRDGAYEHVATFPQDIHHYERRGSFRLNLPADLGISSTLFGGAGEALRSQLTDLSRQGAGAWTHGGLSGEVGSLIPCIINLPSLRVSTEAEVRTLRKFNGGVRMGLLFAGLAPAQRQGVNQAVAAVERLLVRHHALARSTS